MVWISLFDSEQQKSTHGAFTFTHRNAKCEILCFTHIHNAYRYTYTQWWTRTRWNRVLLWVSKSCQMLNWMNGCRSFAFSLSCRWLQRRIWDLEKKIKIKTNVWFCPLGLPLWEYVTCVHASVNALAVCQPLTGYTSKYILTRTLSLFVCMWILHVCARA